MAKTVEHNYYMGTKGLPNGVLLEPEMKEQEWLCEVCYESQGVRCKETGVKPTQCHFQPPNPKWRKA